MTDSLFDSPSPRKRGSALSPAARSLRLQRIFARLQDGVAYADIAVEEGFSRGITVTRPPLPFRVGISVTQIELVSLARHRRN